MDFLLVAAKVIRQCMFSLHYLFSYIKIFQIEIKKDIIVLLHKNPDKMAKCHTRPIFDHANLVISLVPNINQKNWIRRVSTCNV